MSATQTATQTATTTNLRVDLKVYTKTANGGLLVEGLPSPAGSRFDPRPLKPTERSELALALLGGKRWV